MTSLVLSFTNPQGDEVGRLPLSDFAIPEAGGDPTPVSTALAGNLTHLLDRIETAVSEEQMILAVDELDLRILLSQTLLSSEPRGEALFVPVPVRLPDTAPAVSLSEDLSLLNDLFDLTDPEASNV